MIYVEVTIDKTKPLPPGAASALAVELNSRLLRTFPAIEAIVRLASRDGLSVRNGTAEDKDTIQDILQETWEGADDWFF